MSNPQAVKFIITRESDDESTFAVVTGKVTDPANVSEGPFLDALTKALTEWAASTPEGRDALVQSDEDFNVGDLAHEIGTDSLTLALKKHGLHDIGVETHCKIPPTTHWTYDTRLVEGEPCEECGNFIPLVQTGGLANKHHEDSCSLYDPDLN